MWDVGKAMEAGPADAFEVKELLLGVPAQECHDNDPLKMYMVQETVCSAQPALATAAASL